MKICWIADFRDIDRQGGAQLTNRLFIHYNFVLKKDKHVIDEFGLHNLKDAAKFKEGYDLYIINNWAELYLTPEGKEFLNFVVNNKKFIRFVHDYDGFYSERLMATTKGDNIREKIFSKANRVITLSPLHTRELRKLYPLPKYVFERPPFIETMFYDMKLARLPDTVIGVGEIAKHKGIENFIKFSVANPNKKFYFFTWSKPPEGLAKPQNVYFNKAVFNHYLHFYYNMFDSFIHLPEWNEPFGRAVAEAYFCNAEMIINDNIGFFSYPWKYDDRDAVRNIINSAPKDFWNTVNGAF